MLRNPILQISLFIAHFILALGMIMDSKWVHEGKVQVGTYCTTQGRLRFLFTLKMFTSDWCFRRISSIRCNWRGSVNSGELHLNQSCSFIHCVIY